MAKLTALIGPLLTALVISGTSLSETHETIIETQNEEQQQLAEWALGRYAEAGLDLPPLVIRFPGRDLSFCDGAQARAYLAQDPVEVRMCWNDSFILLHELAHVWEAHHVSHDRHERFMGLRDGVEFWASLEVAWDERGREHAANVIAWGLLQDPYLISRTYPNDPASMIDAFTYLTDVEPLHDGGPGVQQPDRSLYRGRHNAALESGR